MDDQHDEYFVTARPTPPATPSDPPPGPGRGDGPSGPGRGGVVAGALVAIVVVGAVLATVSGGGGTAPTPDRPVAAATATEAATGAVGSVQQVVEDGFALWGIREDGSPVRWNPCEPIRWVLNREGAPASAQADIVSAMALVTDASGLTFRFDGFTDERPSWERPLHQPARYGDVWAPVLFSWSSAAEGLGLEAQQRGAAVPVAVTSTSAGTLFVTGQVIFNGDKQLRPGFGDRHESWGAVVAHEIGHLVGLDHVDDPTELMYAEAGFGRSAFGAGDRRGLAAVGADGGCLEVPVPKDLPVDYRDDAGS